MTHWWQIVLRTGASLVINEFHRARGAIWLKGAVPWVCLRKPIATCVFPEGLPPAHPSGSAHNEGPTFYQAGVLIVHSNNCNRKKGFMYTREKPRVAVWRCNATKTMIASWQCDIDRNALFYAFKDTLRLWEQERMAFFREQRHFKKAKQFWNSFKYNDN